MLGILGTNRTFTVSFTLDFVKGVGADVEQIKYPFAIVESGVKGKNKACWRENTAEFVAPSVLI